MPFFTNDIEPTISSVHHINSFHEQGKYIVVFVPIRRSCCVYMNMNRNKNMNISVNVNINLHIHENGLGLAVLINVNYLLKYSLAFKIYF